MTEASTDLPELDTAIRTVYRGPLEEFVRRRDAMTKQLRGGGRREDAEHVKALRKPSRIAWALNSVAFDDAAAMERLLGSLTAAQASGGDDLRAVLGDVRAAARDFAAAASRAAIAAGHPIEPASLVHAVTAVIGDAGAFAALLSGRLVEIPDAGGLDFLAAVSPSAAPPPGKTSQPPAMDRAERVAAVRADLEQAEASLADARARRETAGRAVQDAQAKLETAEQRFQQAKDEADARRAELERARKEAKAITAQVDKAERAVADLRARMEDL
jgi:hypothetical protein